jgi:hypothetical protein
MQALKHLALTELANRTWCLRNDCNKWIYDCRQCDENLTYRCFSKCMYGPRVHNIRHMDKWKHYFTTRYYSLSNGMIEEKPIWELTWKTRFENRPA